MDHLLTDSVVVQVPTTTKGAMGSRVATFTDRDASISCRISPLSSRESREFDASGNSHLAKFYFTEDPVLNRGYRIKTVTVGTVMTDVIYEVVSVDTREMWGDTHWEVVAVHRTTKVN